ncbi:hypothetical protein VTP01DRAFT_10734 [Rhizomucor pusillus]|uniref:uncharacterized protein n=1 Tax=Rhizomucor pusillus TaxID=4840 RepID=UPI0037424BFA
MSLSTKLAGHFISARNEQDLKRIQDEQENCLQIYQKTHRSLEAFNEFSRARYKNVSKRFESHTQLLKEMKQDLDKMFIKLRSIKKQLAEKYPEQYNAVGKAYPAPTIPDD